MLKPVLACLALLASFLALPTAVAPATECVVDDCCEGAVDSDCEMCLEWHYHQPPPPQVNGTYHCHHSVVCHQWVNGVCYCGGPSTICDDIRIENAE